jgi:hypothetical protein
MANLFYPQLASGALAQYPIRKTRLARTIKNVLGDGTMILNADPNGARLIWQLSYLELSTADAQALQTHFNACAGPFHAFTFIDPTDNMLASTSDLTNAAWNTSSLITIEGNITDPEGGSGAFSATNTGQANQEIGQTLSVPAGYQYCFSIFVTSAQASSIELIRRGASVEQTDNLAIGPTWTRIVSSGRLDDSGTNFSIAVSLAAGQQVQLYGFQLEPQIAPSRYRPTGTGGVYTNAHWATDQLIVSADAPNLFSTSFNIETAI